MTDHPDKDDKELSVVAPIFNEEETVRELYDRLTKTLNAWCEKEGFQSDCYEIILVDDGSRDLSWQLIKELHKKDPRVKGIKFSRNFGHHIAVTAGLDHSKGKAVVLMDGDLQDPPEEIPKLYEKYKSGYDLVYGIRRERQDPFLKKVNSNLFWWVINALSGIHMPVGQTMMRIMSRRLLDAVISMREYSRFIHGMIAWTGFETTSIEVNHEARRKGESKYGIIRQLRLAAQAITSFSVKPLRLAIVLGIMVSMFSCVLGVYLIIKWMLFGYPVMGWASTIVSIFFMGGVQLFVLGIVGEYIGRIYQEAQKRPLYILSETLL